ncbi:hypothetical protein BJX63DRAFT_304243 [Aspergillus granulosus]|uniref:Secreted protein n=1 Tax=Aspergillus granulosus TaxID=176169 RepID=A0ABR4H5N6_9EURO
MFDSPSVSLFDLFYFIYYTPFFATTIITTTTTLERFTFDGFPRMECEEITRANRSVCNYYTPCVPFSYRSPFCCWPTFPLPTRLHYLKKSISITSLIIPRISLICCYRTLANLIRQNRASGLGTQARAPERVEWFPLFTLASKSRQTVPSV